jgi:hypothetical protein
MTPDARDIGPDRPRLQAAVRAFHDIGIPLESCSDGHPHLCVNGRYSLFLHSPLDNPWLDGQTEHTIHEATHPDFLAALVQTTKTWVDRNVVASNPQERTP